MFTLQLNFFNKRKQFTTYVVKMSSENLNNDDEHSKNLEIKTTSITDEYNVDWNQKLGTGISGPVRLATKRSQLMLFCPSNFL